MTSLLKHQDRIYYAPGVRLDVAFRKPRMFLLVEGHRQYHRFKNIARPAVKRIKKFLIDASDDKRK